MIKYIGNSTCLARVHKKDEPSYVEIIDISEFNETPDGFYNAGKKLYIDEILSISKVCNVESLSSCHYVGLTISKIAYGSKIIWELVSSCFGSGIWKEDAKWSETETWKE